MKKEYLYKIICPDFNKIYYIGYVFGGWHVFCTDAEHSFNYSVYGGYKNIGIASNRLYKISKNVTTEEFYYKSKEKIIKDGAFYPV